VLLACSQLGARDAAAAAYALQIMLYNWFISSWLHKRGGGIKPTSTYIARNEASALLGIQLGHHSPARRARKQPNGIKWPSRPLICFVSVADLAKKM
jgi:hypothetical protein